MPDVYVNKINTCKYPVPPFHPAAFYPEFSKLPYEVEIDQNNEVYDAVRNILLSLTQNQENPLGGFVKKGDKVLIKPNLVRGHHPKGDEYVLSMVTNAAVVRPVIDYILMAAEGDVDITIGDVPLQDADWKHVTKKSGMEALCEFYKTKGIHIKLVDMRLEIAHLSKYDVIDYRIPNPSRKKDMYCAVNLGKNSELIDKVEKSKRFEITDYGRGTVYKHHNKTVNEYFIPKEVLEADVFINIPKLKTHRKAGFTCAMKNLIGINGDKSWIAHHTRGMKSKGGDEFEHFNAKKYFEVRVWTTLKNHKLGIKMANFLKYFFQRFIWKGKTYKEVSMTTPSKVYFEGSWYGNDTLWRCIKDLNKIVLYADKNGKMQKETQRKYLCIVDAVLAGEKEGPMEQVPKKFGVVFGGLNPVYVDYVATKLMKYDYKNLPTVVNSFKNRWWALVDKDEESIDIDANRELEDIAQYFEPTCGWKKVL